MNKTDTTLPILDDLNASPFDDVLHEECGVFGAFNDVADDTAAHIALGLHALQHRGQEAAGIVTVKEGQFHVHTALGHVGDNFNSQHVMEKLPGTLGIGHVRYSTAGGSHIRNVQPVFAELNVGGIALAHNGNLTNAIALRRELVARGSLFQSTMDTEVFIHLIATSTKQTVVERLQEALGKIQGAYSLVLLTENSIIGARDPHGVRPLAIGRLGDAYFLASESCAFDIIGAELIREVAPGEMVIIDEYGLRSITPQANISQRFCIFEYIYFARPDSVIEEKSVYEMRKNIGIELAKESHIDADVVVPVPDSGVPAAIGYAEASQIPFELGIIRNHYVGRTFIEPTDTVRHLGVKLKHNANLQAIKGKKVILVDDSIVRGTTSKKIVAMVRAAGACEVHLRIASPPTTHSCFYGVDTPNRDKLLAANYNTETMAGLIEADSLAFISMDGLYRAVGETARNNENPQYCDACFSGDYPIDLIDHDNGDMNVTPKAIS